MNHTGPISDPSASRRSRWARWSGVFNLNDPRWGRQDDGNSAPQDDAKEEPPRSAEPQRPRPNQGSTQGPPDLDELWRDFNRKLGGLFGGNRGGQGGGSSGMQPPSPKATGVGVGLVAGVAVLIWLGTGFFIVQEGQQAVITQFGRYHQTVGAGFQWRMPYPVQSHETVFVTQLRSGGVGRGAIVPATPGGRLAVIGEGREPEAVIPLSKLSEMMPARAQHIDVTVRLDFGTSELGQLMAKTVRTQPAVAAEMGKYLRVRVTA